MFSTEPDQAVLMCHHLSQGPGQRLTALLAAPALLDAQTDISNLCICVGNRGLPSLDLWASVVYLEMVLVESLMWTPTGNNKKPVFFPLVI